MKLINVIPSSGKVSHYEHDKWLDNKRWVEKIIIAYGHYDDGNVYPMIEDDTGKLIPVTDGKAYNQRNKPKII